MKHLFRCGSLESWLETDRKNREVKCRTCKDRGEAASPIVLNSTFMVSGFQEVTSVKEPGGRLQADPSTVKLTACIRKVCTHCPFAIPRAHPSARFSTPGWT